MIAELINKHAIAHNVRPDVVACIILQESEADTFAWRWEKRFYELHLENKTRSQLSGWVPKPGELPSLAGELMQRSQSFGLMQVLGDTARWCGKVTRPYLTVLCDPDIGIDVGCRILAFYLNKAKGDYRTALKFYNGSWEYADKVLKRVADGEHKIFFIGE